MGYVAEGVEALLGADAPTHSWDLVFDPANAAVLSECGIYMLDAADEVIPAALNYLGLNPDSHDPAELVRALEVLKPIRPYITKFDSSSILTHSRQVKFVWPLAGRVISLLPAMLRRKSQLNTWFRQRAR